jgi:membrane protein implicated in regulation of membrane protease activity
MMRFVLKLLGCTVCFLVLAFIGGLIRHSLGIPLPSTGQHMYSATVSVVFLWLVFAFFSKEITGDGDHAEKGNQTTADRV